MTGLANEVSTVKMRINYDKLDPYRVTEGHYASAPGTPCGMFLLPHQSNVLRVLASDGRHDGWEHVSVSLANRTPNWREMCLVKDLFWDHEETVVQFHPRRSEYVDIAKHCLHLWRRIDSEYELPPRILTGW